MATMRGRTYAFVRVSTAAALAAFLLAGCGDKEQPDIFAGAAGGIGGPVQQPVQSAQAAATGDISKSTLSKGTEFIPDMLGLQPGGTNGELRFNWFSGNKDDSSQTFVRVFEGDALVASAAGTSGVTDKENYRYHKAAVSGLKQNTEYTYWVSNNGVDWSVEYKYTSPSSSGPFRFAAVSDVQNADGAASIAKWKAIAAKVAEEGASLIVNAGDHIQECSADAAGGGEESYRQFFSAPELRNIPTAPVMGNHDRCKNFEEHFNLPNVVSVTQTDYVSKSGSNYYFLYNKVLFVGLNTSPWPPAGNAAGFVADYRTTIQAAINAHRGKYDFLVVTHHRTTTSISADTDSHVLDRDIRDYVTAGLQRLMTEMGVNLVLTGHDHIYVRSQFMNGDNISEDGTGTLYLTLKPGGKTRNYNSKNGGDVGFEITSGRTQYVNSYPFLNQSYTRKVPNPNNTKYFLPRSHKTHSYYNGENPGYTIVDVAYGKMTIKVYEEDGSLCDEINLERKPVGVTASGRLFNF